MFKKILLTKMLSHSELSDVKQHDCRVSEEARSAQKELKSALEESSRNADILTEYHSLYELQRGRLEQQVGTSQR